MLHIAASLITLLCSILTLHAISTENASLALSSLSYAPVVMNYYIMLTCSHKVLIIKEYQSCGISFHRANMLGIIVMCAGIISSLV